MLPWQRPRVEAMVEELPEFCLRKFSWSCVPAEPAGSPLSRRVPGGWCLQDSPLHSVGLSQHTLWKWPGGTIVSVGGTSGPGWHFSSLPCVLPILYSLGILGYARLGEITRRLCPKAGRNPQNGPQTFKITHPY